MLQPIESWVLQNPVWVDGPIRVWLALWIMAFFGLSLRYGSGEARDMLSRRWGLFIGSGIPVVAWAFYAYTVTHGTGL